MFKLISVHLINQTKKLSFRNQFLLNLNIFKRYLIWEVKNDQGSSWLEGRAPIASSYTRRIIFEAIGSGGSDGIVTTSTIAKSQSKLFNLSAIIAIDDVSLLTSWCDVIPSTARPPASPATTPDPPVTQPPVKYGSADCDFDVNICDWHNDASHNLIWTR